MSHLESFNVCHRDDYVGNGCQELVVWVYTRKDSTLRGKNHPMLPKHTRPVFLIKLPFFQSIVSTSLNLSQVLLWPGLEARMPSNHREACFGSIILPCDTSPELSQWWWGSSPEIDEGDYSRITRLSKVKEAKLRSAHKKEVVTTKVMVTNPDCF